MVNKNVGRDNKGVEGEGFNASLSSLPASLEEKESQKDRMGPRGEDLDF